METWVPILLRHNGHLISMHLWNRLSTFIPKHFLQNLNNPLHWNYLLIFCNWWCPGDKNVDVPLLSRTARARVPEASGVVNKVCIEFWTLVCANIPGIFLLLLVVVKILVVGRFIGFQYFHFKRVIKGKKLTSTMLQLTKYPGSPSGPITLICWVIHNNFE